MSLTKSQLEQLGKDVTAGRYISKTTFIFTVILAFMLGGFLGNLVTVLQGNAPTTGTGTPITVPTTTTNQPHLQELQEAAKLEAMLTTNPSDTATWTKLGNLYYDAHQYIDAIRCYETSLTLQPNNPDVLTDLGTMYRSAKEYDKALAAFDRAIVLDGRHQFARLNKGIVLLYDLERVADAKRTWEDLLAIYPDAKIADGRSLRSILDAL